MMATPDLQEHTIWQFVEMGLAVVPLAHRSKDRPLVKWKPFQKTPPTDEQVAQWITAYPHCNWAIITGPRVVVVDADSEEAMAWVEANITRTPWHVNTSKGAHYYYQANPNVIVPNSVNRQASVDTRGMGGYVVAPGSIHKSGHIYTLHADPDQPISSLHDLPMLSNDDLKAIMSVTHTDTPQAPSEVTGGNLTALGFDLGAELKRLEGREDKGVQEGSRNDQLARMVGRWVGQGLNPDQALAKALAINAENNPPLPTDEVRQTVASIIQTHLLNPDNEQTQAQVDPTHPMLNFRDLSAIQPRAPAMVIDGVIHAGAVVVAGGPGAGKTSVIVPMALAATGLMEHYPLSAKIRRRVIYVSEDVEQVERIIWALKDSGQITCPTSVVNDSFRLVDAKRLPAAYMAQVADAYRELATPNDKRKGGQYMAMPWLILDTTSATLDVEDSSDNSGVSHQLAVLRQQFGTIPLCFIAHMSKGARNKEQLASVLGATAWEGDVTQVLYVEQDDDDDLTRYLRLGKRRFETDVTEYRLHSTIRQFPAFDELDDHVELKVLYAIPEALQPGTLQQLKEAQKEERSNRRKEVNLLNRCDDIVKFLAANPRSSGRDIKAAVGGGNVTLSALDRLYERGEIQRDDGANGHEFSTKNYFGQR